MINKYTKKKLVLIYWITSDRFQIRFFKWAEPLIVMFSSGIEVLINLHRRVSTKNMAAALKISGCTLIMMVCLFQPLTASAADTLAEIQVPNEVLPALMHLLKQADPDHQADFDSEQINKLLDYIEAPKDANALYFVNPQLGSPSSYYEFDLHRNLEHILKYTFNPNVPGFLMTPSSMRLSHWEQIRSRDQQVPDLWNMLAGLDAPIIVKGVQFVENTPDLFSGAYYSYQLDRALILFKHNNRRALVSISKQRGPSDVGKKGYVLGSDDNWDYVYSGKPGLTIPGLGWVRSHMYDSYGINIYYEIDPQVPLLRCAVFKWLRAGWSKINAVKKNHIHRGIKRFANSFKEIMEHPSLPDINAFSESYSKIKALSDEQLREKIEIYVSLLEKRYGRNYRPPGTWSPEIFKDKSPWYQMSTEAMQSVLMLEYIKKALGKTDDHALVALLNLPK